MNIVESTLNYERWLTAHTRIDKVGLQQKHQLMAKKAFPFLRATFYRWLQLWPSICPDLHRAPTVLAVGDLHVENFGTWRDAEGRLVWGINDFDEAAHLPYTADLVRLATSSLLAIADAGVRLKPSTACDRILEGYSDATKSGGLPFVLAERNRFLRDIAVQELKDPQQFWDKMEKWPDAKKSQVPPDVIAAIEKRMPKLKPSYRIVLRQAGLGSRGHQRFVAIYSLYGGLVAREVKALVPSAANWVDCRHTPQILYSEILADAVRDSDVTFGIESNWLIRRLAPDCTKISIAELPDRLNQERLLYCMGWETANVHLGTKNAIPEIAKDLKKRKSGWLFESAKAMTKVVRNDWRDWRTAQK